MQRRLSGYCFGTEASCSVFEYKVDVLKNTGCDKQGSVQSNSATGTRGNYENISCGVDADKIDTQNSFAEQNICGEGQIEGPINGHTFQNYGKRNMASLDSYMGDELKKRVLSEVDEVLRTDRMDNYDCISVAVSEQLNEVLEQHCKNFETVESEAKDPFQEEVDTRSLRHGAAPLAYLLTHQRH